MDGPYEFDNWLFVSKVTVETVIWTQTTIFSWT